MPNCVKEYVFGYEDILIHCDLHSLEGMHNFRIQNDAFVKR